MTSLPIATQFAYGSASSSYSVREAIASYRRSQYLAASIIPSTSDLSEGSDIDQEAH
ncbi:hypothetical protein BV22DRAFT_970297, partial [Leucogyrophana mollusca]